MRPFTRGELTGLLVIFAIVFLVTLQNMQIALRRARDSQRRSDIGAISDALNKFQSEFGYFPLSSDGKIKICKGEKFEEVMRAIQKSTKFERNLFFEGLRPCEWGDDTFSDVTDPDYEPYLKTIPSDPKQKEGYSYLYLANENRYQIYTAMEGGDSEIGYDAGIVKRNLSCGKEVCSYGKSYSVPLHQSIEDHERELHEKANRNRDE